MWTPEHIEATLFLLTIFVSLFLGAVFSIQAMNCKDAEKRLMSIVSAAFLLAGIALTAHYFL